MKRDILRFLTASGVALLLLAAAPVEAKKKKRNPGEDLSSSAEPDKLLYQRAMDDFKHGRYERERLNLQTLINTYPDSEYLAKAKLAVGDSYYKEGGTSGLTQAIAEYKDFITFFPFLDEAPYAQMRVAMAHYRMLAKPDRDRTQAFLAEEEFQNFLLKYPQSSLVPQAEQKLRDVQEMIAEADFRVARYYYVGGDFVAAAPRLVELTNRFPLYSQSDKALWMLALSFEKRENTRDKALPCYARIAREYPNSPFAPEAKKRLIAAGIAVPQPDPAALSLAMAEGKNRRHHAGLVHRSWGILTTGPDVSTAARAGKPNLDPEPEPVSAGDVFSPPAGGRTPGAISSGGPGATGGGTGNSVGVEVVPEGPAGASSGEGNSNHIESQPLKPQPTTDPAPAPPASAAPPAAPPGGDPATGPSGQQQPAATDGNNGSTASPATPTTQQGAASQPPASGKADPGKESSSKKKKGLHKVLPW